MENKIIKPKDLERIIQSSNLFIMNQVFIFQKDELATANILYNKANGAESIFYDAKSDNGAKITQDTYKLSQKGIFNQKVFDEEEIFKLSGYTGVGRQIFDGTTLLTVENLSINIWIIYYCLKTLSEKFGKVVSNKEFKERRDYIKGVLFEFRLNKAESEEEKYLSKECLNIDRELQQIIQFEKGDLSSKEENELDKEFYKDITDTSKALYKYLEGFFKYNIRKQTFLPSGDIYMLQLQLFLLNMQKQNPPLLTSLNNIQNYLGAGLQIKCKDIEKIKRKTKNINREIKQLLKK